MDSRLFYFQVNSGNDDGLERFQRAIKNDTYRVPRTPCCAFNRHLHNPPTNTNVPNIKANGPEKQFRKMSTPTYETTHFALIISYISGKQLWTLTITTLK